MELPSEDSWSRELDRIPDGEGLESLDTLGLYSRRIGKIALLNAGQEVELAQTIEAGLFAREKLEQSEEEGYPALDEGLRRDLGILARQGEQATAHLVSANLRLVVDRAQRYKRARMDMLDLIQEGNKGLIRAVQKFDYTKGYKFSSYAVPAIDRAIERGIADQSRTIRLPTHVHELVIKTVKAEEKFLGEHGRLPADDEVAVTVRTSLDWVREVRFWANYPIVSTDAPVGDTGATTFGDLIIDNSSDTDVADQGSSQRFDDGFKGLLAGLSDEMRQVVSLKLGLDGGGPMTASEVGAVLRKPAREVTNLHTAALRWLRKHLNNPAVQ